MAKTYRTTAFRRFGNIMTEAMIKTGVAPGGMYLVTVRGRESGLPRTVPVNLIEHQGHRWLVAPYGEVDWVRNARAAGEVELRQSRTTEHAQVSEVPAEEAAPVLQSYLKRHKSVVGSYFDVTPDSPDASFVAEAPRHPVFRIAKPSS